MLRASFDYMQYYKFKTFPTFILKKSWTIDFDKDTVLPSVYTSPSFNINSPIFSNFSQVACMVLPDYSLQQGGNLDDYNTKRSRGLAIKTSFSRQVRGQRNYVYLECGNKFFVNFTPMINSFDFVVQIYLPQVKAKYSTLFRESNPINNFSTTFTVYMYFK
jgi:hypothetical protein